MIIIVLLDDQVCPGHEIGPQSSGGEAVADIGNWPILGESQNFSASHDVMELHEHLNVAVVVVAAGVAVIPQNVDPIFARVPVGLGSAPDPNEVIDGVVCIDAVEDDLQQLLAGGGSLGSPPEPLASSLMKRTPENGNLRGLQPFELDSNSVDVPDGRVVLRGIGDHRFGHIEVSVVGVEGAGPQLAAHRREPVPMEGHNALPICAFVPVDGILDCAIIIGLPIIPRVVWGVVLHIKTLHQRALPYFSLQLLVVVVRLPRKDGLSVIV